MVVNYCDRERISVTYCVLQIFFLVIFISICLFFIWTKQQLETSLSERKENEFPFYVCTQIEAVIFCKMIFNTCSKSRFKRTYSYNSGWVLYDNKYHDSFSNWEVTMLCETFNSNYMHASWTFSFAKWIDIIESDFSKTLVWVRHQYFWKIAFKIISG